MKGGVQPEEIIYEHLVHNKYFPESRYRFEGISDELGDVRLILSQEYIESHGRPTDAQIEAALKEKGFKRKNKYTFENEEVTVTDVFGDNAIVGKDGRVYFIDPIINFKKPARHIFEIDVKPNQENREPIGGGAIAKEKIGLHDGKVVYVKGTEGETIGVRVEKRNDGKYELVAEEDGKTKRIAVDDYEGEIYSTAPKANLEASKSEERGLENEADSEGGKILDVADAVDKPDIAGVETERAQEEIAAGNVGDRRGQEPLPTTEGETPESQRVSNPRENPATDENVHQAVSFAQRVAERLSYRVEVITGDANMNGFISFKDGVIHINKDRIGNRDTTFQHTQSEGWVIGHELYHAIAKALGRESKQLLAFEQACIRMASMTEGFRKYYADMYASYVTDLMRTKGMTLDGAKEAVKNDGFLNEEIAGDFVGKLLESERMQENFFRELENMQDRTMVGEIMHGIKNAAISFKNSLSDIALALKGDEQGVFERQKADVFGRSFAGLIDRIETFGAKKSAEREYLDWAMERSKGDTEATAKFLDLMLGGAEKNLKEWEKKRDREVGKAFKMEREEATKFLDALYAEREKILAKVETIEKAKALLEKRGKDGERSVESGEGDESGVLSADASAISDKPEVWPVVVGDGFFGTIYEGFKGRVKAAFDFLMEHKSGDLLGVFHRDEVGDIDMVWGDNNGGLLHIIELHVGEGKDFATVGEAQDVIIDVINTGKPIVEKHDKVVFEKDGKRVVVRKNLRDGSGAIINENKNWVVTSYDANIPKSKKNRPDSALATPEADKESRAVALGSSYGKDNALSVDKQASDEKVEERFVEDAKKNGTSFNDDSRKSLSGIIGSAGFEYEIGDDGKLRLSRNGKIFDAAHPIAMADILGQEDTPLAYLLEFARTISHTPEETILRVANGYAQVLNLILQKGGGAGDFRTLCEEFLWRGDPYAHTILDNGDSRYTRSVDNTAVCKKNIVMIESLISLSQKLGRGYTPGEVLNTLEAIARDPSEFESTCPQCYVMSRYVSNGSIGTAIEGFHAKYGHLVRQVAEMSETEKADYHKQWTDIYYAELKERKKNSSAITKAKQAARDNLSLLEVLGQKYLKDVRELADPDISAIRRRTIETSLKRMYKEYQSLSHRYETALGVLARADMPNIIKYIIFEKGKAEEGEIEEPVELGDAEEESDKGFKPEQAKLSETNHKYRPEDPAERARLFYNAAPDVSLMNEYPGYSTRRRAIGAGGGKVANRAADTAIGDIATSLSAKGNARERYRKNNISNVEYRLKNTLIQLSNETDPKKKAALKKQARNEFAKSVAFAILQNGRGALRFQSWSDFEPRNGADFVISLLETSLINSGVQVYSKQLESLDIFGTFNAYGNGSLIGEGKGYVEATKDNTIIWNGRECLKEKQWVLDVETGQPMEYHEPVIEVDGKKVALVFDTKTGIRYYGHFKNGTYRKGLYDLMREHDTIGDVVIGMNDTHILAYLAHKNTNFVIPFHASGNAQHFLSAMFSVIRKHLAKTDATDYTDVQEESFKAEVKINNRLKGVFGRLPIGRFKSYDDNIGFNADGSISESQKRYRALYERIKVGDWKKEPLTQEEINLIEQDEFLSQTYHWMLEARGKYAQAVNGDGHYASRDKTAIFPFEYWDYTSTKDNADINGVRYLEFCKRLGVVPKFSGSKSNGAEAKHGFFCEADGYWKLLIDRRMYNRKGEGQWIEPVDPNGFNAEQIDIENYGKTFEVTPAFVPEKHMGVIDRISEKAIEIEQRQLGEDVNLRAMQERLYDPALSLTEACDIFKKANKNMPSGYKKVDVKKDDFVPMLDEAYKEGAVRGSEVFEGRKSLSAAKDDNEALSIISKMETNAAEIRYIELNDDNWVDSISTPIGSIRLGENQKTKLLNRERADQYGMLLDTFTRPDLILAENDKVEDVKHERPFTILFIKTFKKEDGAKYVHFESATISRDGFEISISSHIIRKNQLREKLKNDKLLFKATALDEPTNSSTEQLINVGGSLSSASKDITLPSEKQTERGKSLDDIRKSLSGVWSADGAHVFELMSEREKQEVLDMVDAKVGSSWTSRFVTNVTNRMRPVNELMQRVVGVDNTDGLRRAFDGETPGERYERTASMVEYRAKRKMHKYITPLVQAREI